MDDSKDRVYGGYVGGGLLYELTESWQVDAGGDVTRTLETHHYYELGVGWLFDMDGGPSWLKTLGINVMMNTGSALSGGSLVLLYNEDW